jgi:hypothetical protein
VLGTWRLVFYHTRKSIPFPDTDPALPQAIEHYESLMTSEVGDSTTQTQSTLTLALHSRARATLLASADLRNNARLLSLTLPQAHSWLLAVPYKPPYSWPRMSSSRLLDTDSASATTATKATFDADSATRSKTLATKVCHTGTTQLNAMVEAPFTAATTASTIFFIIVSRRPATVPRWKLRISYQAASSVLETSTCRLEMTA